MKAYHATNAKFAEFDFGRLGEFTEGCDGSAEAVATAKLVAACKIVVPSGTDDKRQPRTPTK